MKYKVKVIGKNKYNFIELKYGSRIQYCDIEINGESYRGILNLEKRNEVFLPNYLAEDIINKGEIK